MTSFTLALTATGKAVHQGTTPVQVSSLAEGYYTVKVSVPGGYELAHATDGLVHVYLTDGQVFDFGQELVFRPVQQLALPAATVAPAKTPALPLPAPQILAPQPPVLIVEAQGLPASARAEVRVHDPEHEGKMLSTYPLKAGKSLQIPVKKRVPHLVDFAVNGSVVETAEMMPG